MRLSRPVAQRCSAFKLGWIALVLFLALSAHAAIMTSPQRPQGSSSEVVHHSLIPQTAHERDLQFAQDQIRQFESLLGDLSERAEETGTLKMKDALSGLDAQIQLATSNLAQARSHQRDPFVREKLRSSILTLQESGRRALGLMIESDSNQRFAQQKLLVDTSAVGGM